MTFYSPLASPRATIDKLTEWGLSTNKSLGQHFLIDDGVVGRILRVAEVTPGDEVLEVGPGIGTLTEALLKAGAHVSSIEKDDKLLPVLAELKSRYPSAFTLIHGDALSMVQGVVTNPSGSSGAAIEKSMSGSEDCLSASFARVPQKLSGFSIAGAQGEPDGFVTTPSAPTRKFIANLPYAVAATLVLDYFEKLPSLQSATIMVQKEVAERMMAKPGSKDYGAYTVKLSLFAQPTASFAVARTNFLPPPRVDSTVIRLDRRAVQPSFALIKATFTVVEAAFAERRKTIRNSMRSYFSTNKLDPEQVDVLLEVVGIPATVRGETLGTEDYLALGEAFNSFD